MFFCDSVGSLAIGIIFGVITALITKVTGHVKSKQILENICLFNIINFFLDFPVTLTQD